MDSLDTAELIAQLSYSLALSYVGAATSGLVLYEYLITFSSEVQLFWRKKITGASILFFINRYLMFVYTLFYLWSYSPLTGTASACRPFGYMTTVLEIANYMPWAGFSALRVFALSGMNMVLGIVVFVMSLGPLIINLVSLQWKTFYYDPVQGCNEYIHTPVGLAMKFTIISRTSLIAADVVVIISTWLATYNTVIKSRRVLNGDGKSLSRLLLRDGTMYFMILLILNVLQLAFSTGTVLTSIPGAVGIISALSEPLTSILISRFMMNLQEARQVTSGSTAVSQSVSTVQFDRVVESIGEPVEQSMFEPEITVDDYEGPEQPGDEVLMNSLP